MSGNGHNPTAPRPPAVITVQWNPNTGAFNYQSKGVNGMEELGLVQYAMLLRFQQLQGVAPGPRIERANVLPADLLRGRG
jgi:hypothetical protein